MSSHLHAQGASNALVPVDFHGHSLITLERDGEIFVAMKPVVEGIGLQWRAQYHRIRRNEILNSCVSVMDTQLPSDTQSREVVFLPLRLLNGWLFGIDARRVRAEIRETVLTYQRECFDVLWRHWHPEARPSTPPPPSAPEDFRLLTTYKNGVAVRREVLGPEVLPLTFDQFMSIAEQCGVVVPVEAAQPRMSIEQAGLVFGHLERLTRLFHPLSDPAGDVQAIARLLRGRDHKLGSPVQGFADVVGDAPWAAAEAG